MTDLDQITPALIAFQTAMPVVGKAQTADTGTYKYSYASLADVMATATPLLQQHNLAFVVMPRATDKGYEVVGRVIHTSGQYLEGALPLHGNKPQDIGSALSYARRYLAGCLLGIVTDDDPDGRMTQPAPARTRAWDGPTTVELLNQIDADAQRAGVTYEQATVNLRRDLGNIGVDGLDALDPWMVKPFADKVHAHANKVVAEREAAGATEKPGAEDKPAAEQPKATAAGEPGDPWGPPA